MNDTATRYSSDVQRRIDRHLGAIARVLDDAGLSKHDREAIVDEVELQVRDTLAERIAPGTSPSLAEVEAVLSELDPPESYADRDAPRAAPPAPPSIAGRMSLGLTLLGFAFLIAIVLIDGSSPAAGRALGLLIFVALLAFPIALVFGLIGRRSAAGKLGAAISGVCVVVELAMLVMNTRID